MLSLDTSLEYLKGIGPERAALLKNVLGLRTVSDLLEFYPLRYLDKSRVVKISELHPQISNEIQLKGIITEVREVGSGRQKRLLAKFADTTGTLELVWFQYSKWMRDQLPLQKEIFIFGRLNFFNQQFSMPHPEIELQKDEPAGAALLPVYPSSEKLTKRGLNQKFFRSILKTVCLNIPSLITENLPTYLISKLKLMSRQEAFLNIHFPESERHIKQAERRIKFEEAFFFQLSFCLKKNHHKSHTVGNPFPVVGKHFNNFYKNILPFELTDAQKRVLKEIRIDLRKPIQMNRLLQGDVGSGKTVVALLAMLLALDNGFQSCVMAPTEILAQQHYQGISELLEGTGIQVRLLTGSKKTAERRSIHTALKDGSLHILIGTHALLENIVEFKNLGLAIIDEQHRFGVAQRARLWAKSRIPPHILVMTATPIPRTLAMSFYSDLEVSVIDELPANRKPIITAHRREKDRLSVYNFAKDEIAKGRQIYFVYPLIEESETLDYKNLMEGAGHIMDFFPDENITILHGQMKPDEKEASMQLFASGTAKIMVATTVIEVGVNVPNASVMVIESTERFGLAQLHQLRGRVGRGAEQSYCILMSSDKLSADSRKRIKTMVETNDGFKISEVDMELRGPGDILGTQQSGVVDFKKLDLISDSDIILAAKQWAEKIVDLDPALNSHEHQKLKEYYSAQYRQRHKWSKIS